MSARRRLTIGLVTANIHLGVGATLWSGALDAARRHDVNLICFPGGEVGATDRPRNRVYDLVGPELLDGLICWTSTLGLPVAHARAARLERRFGRLPMVSLNGTMGEDRPLTLDSYRGMCLAISHLVEVHDRRRLAFIRGTVANPVIVERYRAYTDTLARHRIPLDDTLVSAPVDFHLEAGASAMRVLLDARSLKPGRDFDAVVACSDFLAADALRVLSERGVRVPEDVAVVGVNDSPEATLVDPPLTSVSMPFGELGELAVATLVARLRGCDAAVVPSPASTLVVRRSCGCPGARAEDAEPEDPGVDRLDALRTELTAASAGAGAVSAAGRRALCAALLGALDGPHRAFLGEVDRLVTGMAAGSRDVDAWDTALVALRQVALRHLTGPARTRAGHLLDRARLVAADAGRRLLEYERWHADQTSRHLRELGNALSAAVDPKALTEVLDRQLPALGVPGCQLLLDPSRPPAPALPGDRRYSMVAEPLYVRDELLGFGLFEVGPRSGAVYRALGDQIGACVKEIRLFDEVRAARDLAEQANRVKTTLLNSVNDELRAPVLDIRRRVVDALRAVDDLAGAPPRLVEGLKEIQVSVEHQLGVLSDLLDLSKAEIDTLDLTPELVDPGALLTEVARHRQTGRLPLIQADRRRLRQALVSLHGCAERLAGGPGTVTVETEVVPPALRIRFRRTGNPRGGADPADTGLALPITRRLITLHNGSLRFDSGPGGVEVAVTLPLPCPHGGPDVADADHVLLVGRGTAPLPRLLPARHLHAGDDLASVLADTRPAAVVWDQDGAAPEDWAVVRVLHDHPALRRVPFLVYGEATGRDLDELIAARRPAELAGPVLIADVDPDTQATYQRIVARARPGRPVHVASDGAAALAALDERTPGLVVVSRTLPDMDGFDLLDRLHGDGGLPGVPILVLSGRTITMDDVRRAEPYARLVLLGKGILSDDETAELLARLSGPRQPGPRRSGVLVKNAVAFLHQHFHHQITRRQVAQAAGMSEDYLSRTFHRELGVSPWEYLNRLRVERAKERLRETDDSVQVVARRVGFHDRAYFSRMFRKLTGMPPQAYRDSWAPQHPGAGGSRLP
ncbi:substrate-binding domain-containing protein [Actinophytocola gossypii]|uniref:histidine kinase n=1 Tax=Actinophytocola gossypii TaxID=2812003 RepID=A0ABT2J127_9PSEU|nr:substrate-binding domain-containing protein [Actinophytocola gossypii]MCT2581562.1 substrate-binding domain-containing protein [Actinophytocola gossypii]